MADNKTIRIDGNDPLFDTKGMFYKEFPSDLRQVRFFSLLIVQKAPAEIKEINLLEQQVSELIKNAVRHGNKMDPSKKVRVWASFSKNHAHLVVEDEGEGFQDLEKWNEFNLKRTECFEQQNFEELEKYFSYRSETSNEDDGGNALFAALEYWDGGIVFNDARNAVAVYKYFGEKKRPGLDLSSA
jgi:hypothetical protein